MPDDFLFPPLRTGVLHGLLTLKERYDAEPTILDSSPYENEAREMLRLILKAKVVEKIKEVEVVREVKAGRGRPTKDVLLTEEDQETVRTNIAELIDQLNRLGTGENEQLETNERIQIIKTKASLNEQLLKMQERVFNVKRMSDFQSTVISLLDDLVSEQDRNVFLKRLSAYRD